MITLPRLVLVGSTGRDTGKTTLACGLISQLKQQHGGLPVVAFKVITIGTGGHHCHKGDQGCGLCGSLEGPHDLRRERGDDPEKDTARMLAAGADSAFLMRAHTAHLEQGLLRLLAQVPENALLVGESNSLREAVTPGVFLFAVPAGFRPPAGEPPPEEVKPSARRVMHLADKVVPHGEMNPVLHIKTGADGAPAVSLKE